MMTTRRFLLATSLPLASLATAPAAAQVVPMQAVVPDGTILDVSATGRATAVPDVAGVRAGVVTQAPTAGAALADNAARMARVLAAVKAAGVAARDVKTDSVQLSPQYRYGENVPPTITGYQASNTVHVRLREIARAGRVLDALVAAGANQIDGPSLTLDAPDTALDQARADAVARAKARADLYARAAGLRVERIVSIAEAGENDGGSPQPPMPMAFRARAEAAPTAIAPGEADVTATLSVCFLLK